MSTYTYTPTEEHDTSASLALQQQLPGMDGYTAERLAVNFGGAVELDRTNAGDVQFVKDLTMFREVQLTVTAVVVDKAFPGKLGRDGQPDSVGHRVTLRVVGVEVA